METSHFKFQSSGVSIALWSGVIGAPAIWAVQMQLGYAIAPWNCGKTSDLPAHLVPAIALLLVLVSLVICYRDWKSTGGGSPDEPAAGTLGRTRFLGALGMMLSVFWVMVILAQGIAGFFFDGCW